MVVEIVIGLMALLVITIAVLFAIPKTRPFIKKWWPMAIIIGGGILSALFIKKSKDKTPTSAIDLAIIGAKDKIIDEQINSAIREKVADDKHQYVIDDLCIINQDTDPWSRHEQKKELLNRIRK